jgi:hypothetical protein
MPGNLEHRRSRSGRRDFRFLKSEHTNREAFSPALDKARRDSDFQLAIHRERGDVALVTAGAPFVCIGCGIRRLRDWS